MVLPKQPKLQYEDDERDVMLHVMSFLSSKDLVRRCSLVSMQWHRLSTCTDLWLFLIARDLKVHVQLKDLNVSSLLFCRRPPPH